MSLLTRRGTLSGASAMTALTVRAGRRRARAASPAWLGILTHISGAYSKDAGPGLMVATKLVVEDFARIHPELPAADAGTKTDAYGRSMVTS